MSPAPAAAQAPVSVSLFDLSTDAPVLQGLRLVSHFPEEALAQSLQTSCPGGKVWGGPVRDMTGHFGAYCSSREHILTCVSQLRSSS